MSVSRPTSGHSSTIGIRIGSHHARPPDHWLNSARRTFSMDLLADVPAQAKFPPENYIQASLRFDYCCPLFWGKLVRAPSRAHREELSPLSNPTTPTSTTSHPVLYAY